MDKKTLLPFVLLITILVFVVGLYWGMTETDWFDRLLYPTTETYIDTDTDRDLSYAEAVEETMPEVAYITVEDVVEETTFEEVYEPFTEGPYAGNRYVENFPRIDINSLSEDGLNENIEQALRFCYEHRPINDNGFVFYFSFPTLPIAAQHEDVKVVVDEDYSYDGSQVVRLIPVEERLVPTKYMSHEAGMIPYVSLMETYSAERKKIAFDKLYEKHRWIIHRIIDRDAYELDYARIVNQLLLSYADLAEDESRAQKVVALMKEHWRQTLANTNKELADFYDELITFIPEESVERSLNNYSSRDTEYANHAFVMWSYSFWNRRKQEGKTQEIYRLLSLIRNDYAGM